ncbi:uncharacterized protein LOC133199001 [Saccostrea echinata]|uniref:uncharacterized protein LOC133199001 n=1 Tax=Saccostrea echinata TaxID=191078 RepID=UPI002A7FD76C|nr:uncharacterized protein LOC133199001 [Saccostrea echinata]
MAYSYDFLLHLSFVITFSQALLIFEKCTRHSQCPSNARCRPNGCEGYMCRCVSQFVYSDDRSQCVPGKLMGEVCDGNLNKCLSPFAVCMDDVCQCNELMEPTSDGHCKSPYEAELHHSCVDKICVLSTVCDGEVCVCPEDKREITTEEYWLDPLKARKCVDKEYSVDHCHGQQIQIPQGLLEEENSTTPSNKSIKLKVDMVQTNDVSSENIPLNKEQIQEPVLSEYVDGGEETQRKLIQEDEPGTNDVRAPILSVNPDKKDMSAAVDKIKERNVIKGQSDTNVLVDSSEMIPKLQVNEQYSNKSEDRSPETFPSSDNISSTEVENFLKFKTHPKNNKTHVEDIDKLPSDITEDFPTNALSEEKFTSEDGLNKSSNNQNVTINIRNSSTSFEERSSYLKNDKFREITAGNKNLHDQDNFINKKLVSFIKINKDDDRQLNQLVKRLIDTLLERNKKVNIYHGCSVDEQCPEHAQCKGRGCTSQKQCLCREGFMTNINGTNCVPDGSRPCVINEFQCASSRCVPYSWVCDGVTDCPQNEDETKLCSTSHKMDISPREHQEEIRRLEDKLSHETLMRMHLERSIQELRDVVKEIKENEKDITHIEKETIQTRQRRQNPITAPTQSAMDEGDRQISTWSDPFYDGFIDDIQNKLKGSAVYSLWGGKVCPKHENTRTIYTGFMSSSNIKSERGDPGDFLCLPQVPEYDSSSSVRKVFNEHKSVVSGFTYHLSCAVCQVQLVSSVLMIPAKVTCPADWRLEYVGVLVTAGDKKGGSSARHICIEKNALYEGGIEDSRDKGPYLYPVAVECGRIPCPPYKKNDSLSCVVCSF